jgi:uncharacterized protein (TIGR03083 family)
VTLSVETYTNAIKEHSDALAAIAGDVLDVPVEHCPGWAVEDVLRHLIEVHWFWATIVEQRLAERVEDGRPVAVAKSELIERFSAGADHLVEVLRNANQSDHVWTWAPAQNNVAFVTRHQVQEIVVHHFDVAHAAGAPFSIATDVATDSIPEFLSFSVSSEADPADPPRDPLAGSLGLWSTDADEGWTVRDASAPGTVGFSDGIDAGVPTLSARSDELLLWLYSRVDIGGDAEAQALGRRLHALSFTD